MIKQINIVMKSLIPEINIEIYNAFDKLLKDGKDGVQFEIIAMRGENRIPLLYESAGIKKLISICSNRSEERRVGKECRSRWSPYH